MLAASSPFILSKDLLSPFAHVYLITHSIWAESNAYFLPLLVAFTYFCTNSIKCLSVHYINQHVTVLLFSFICFVLDMMLSPFLAYVSFYSCRIHMAPFSDEYLYMEIANKVHTGSYHLFSWSWSSSVLKFSPFFSGSPSCSPPPTKRKRGKKTAAPSLQGRKIDGYYVFFHIKCFDWFKRFVEA